MMRKNVSGKNHLTSKGTLCFYTFDFAITLKHLAKVTLKFVTFVILLFLVNTLIADIQTLPKYYNINTIYITEILLEILLYHPLSKCALQNSTEQRKELTYK